MDTGAIRRRTGLGVALLTAAGLLALAAPADARAAAGSASACAGRKVRTLPFATGAVHVYKRGGYVCAVTLPEDPGPRRSMSVSVQARGNRPVVDKGRYSHRAGPVTVHAGQRCVWVKGAVGQESVSSGWILC
ncbi:hypothetical protein ACIP2X_33540 [Streptomyces sp. NPDC089424]|uniref:hypothetical protein n=1 Tax=Streptomyces sp. NPDC089424 TaxID=3365917 RepID=UPI00381A34F6